MNAVLRTAGDLDKSAWQQAAMICTDMFNYAGYHAPGFTPIRPWDLYPTLYGKVPGADFLAKLERAELAETEYLEALEAKATAEREKQSIIDADNRG